MYPRVSRKRPGPFASSLVDENNLVQKSRVLALTKRSYVADDFAHRRTGIVLAAASEFKIGNARCIFQADGSPHSDYIARRCNMRDAFLCVFYCAVFTLRHRLFISSLERTYHFRAGAALLPQLPRAKNNAPTESRSIVDARDLYLSFALNLPIDNFDHCRKTEPVLGLGATLNAF